MVRYGAAVAIVPVFDPGHRLTAGKILHLGSAAQFRRRQPDIVAQCPDTRQADLVEVHSVGRNSAATASTASLRRRYRSAAGEPGQNPAWLRFSPQRGKQAFAQNHSRDAGCCGRQYFAAADCAVLVKQPSRQERRRRHSFRGATALLNIRAGFRFVSHDLTSQGGATYLPGWWRTQVELSAALGSPWRRAASAKSR